MVKKKLTKQTREDKEEEVEEAKKNATTVRSYHTKAYEKKKHTHKLKLLRERK